MQQGYNQIQQVFDRIFDASPIARDFVKQACQHDRPATNHGDTFRAPGPRLLPKQASTGMFKVGKGLMTGTPQSPGQSAASFMSMFNMRTRKAAESSQGVRERREEVGRSAKTPHVQDAEPDALHDGKRGAACVANGDRPLRRGRSAAQSSKTEIIAQPKTSHQDEVISIDSDSVQNDLEDDLQDDLEDDHQGDLEDDIQNDLEDDSPDDLQDDTESEVEVYIKSMEKPAPKMAPPSSKRPQSKTKKATNKRLPEPTTKEPDRQNSSRIKSLPNKKKPKPQRKPPPSTETIQNSNTSTPLTSLPDRSKKLKKSVNGTADTSQVLKGSKNSASSKPKKTMESDDIKRRVKNKPKKADTSAKKGTEKDPLELTDLPQTRSGRLVKPPLAWWAGQRVFIHPQGEVEIKPPTPSNKQDVLSASMVHFKEDEELQQQQLNLSLELSRRQKRKPSSKQARSKKLSSDNQQKSTKVNIPLSGRNIQQDAVTEEVDVLETFDSPALPRNHRPIHIPAARLHDSRVLGQSCDPLCSSFGNTPVSHLVSRRTTNDMSMRRCAMLGMASDVKASDEDKEKTRSIHKKTALRSRTKAAKLAPTTANSKHKAEFNSKSKQKYQSKQKQVKEYLSDNNSVSDSGQSCDLEADPLCQSFGNTPVSHLVSRRMTHETSMMGRKVLGTVSIITQSALQQKTRQPKTWRQTRNPVATTKVESEESDESSGESCPEGGDIQSESDVEENQRTKKPAMKARKRKDGKRNQINSATEEEEDEEKACSGHQKRGLRDRTKETKLAPTTVHSKHKAEIKSKSKQKYQSKQKQLRENLSDKNSVSDFEPVKKRQRGKAVKVLKETKTHNSDSGSDPSSSDEEEVTVRPKLQNQQRKAGIIRKQDKTKTAGKKPKTKTVPAKSKRKAPSKEPKARNNQTKEKYISESDGDESDGLKKKPASSGVATKKLAKEQKTVQLTDNSDEVDVWNNKQIALYKLALRELNPSMDYFWLNVAQRVGDKNADQCQAYHQRNAPPTTQKKKKPPPKTNTETKKAALTGGVGTLKRKRELKTIIDNFNENHEDDFFDSTPVRPVKRFKVLAQDDDDDSDYYRNMVNTETPVSRHFTTPTTRCAWLPHSKTPDTGLLSPNITNTVNRKNTEVYVHRLSKMPNKKSRVEMSNAINQKEVDPKPSNTSQLGVSQTLFSQDGRHAGHDNDEDSEMEQDYYFSDSN